MNRAIVVLGAGTLVFGSASAYLYNDLRETREQSVALQARVAELEKAATPAIRGVAREAPAIPVNPFGPPAAGVVAAVTPKPAAPPPPPPLPATLAAPVASFGSASGIAGGPGLRMFGGGWNNSKLLENPEYREALKRQQKLMMGQRYPDVQAALQLDDQQADQLFDLLAEQQTRAMTINRPPFIPGTAPDPAAMRDWQAQQQQLVKDNEAAMAAVLGDAGVQQWKTYQSSLPARMQVRELRSTLESTGAPLQPDQAERLVAAMAAEQQRRTTYTAEQLAAMRSASTTSGRAANAEAMLERQRQQQQATRSAVAPILSTEQMRQLERMHASQLEMMEINVKMTRAQAEAEGRGETGIQQNTVVSGFIAEH